jgi:hypothetical protein
MTHDPMRVRPTLNDGSLIWPKLGAVGREREPITLASRGRGGSSKVPNARWGKRLGRAPGRPERQFQAWGLDSRERGLAQGHASQGSGDQGLASSDQSRETVNVGESV